MTKLNQRGSSHIVALLAVVVVAAVGFVGYRVMSSATPAVSPSHSTPVATQVKVPASINSASDVRKADAALSTTSVDGSVNPNTLDSDISSL